MNPDLHNITSQDKDIIHEFNQLQSLMASLDPGQLSDPCIILLVCQMQKEIISAIKDTTDHLLLLTRPAVGTA